MDPSSEGGDSKEHSECWKAIEDGVTNDVFISHILSSMQKKGCPVDPMRFFNCNHCPGGDVGGYYTRDSGVVICQNVLLSKRKVAETLRHELIHAYDDCRVDLSWENCSHHACSEIRAANLSGDCHYRNEVIRGNGFSRWKRQYKECVLRRARISISYNPNCKGREDDVLEDVWDACIRDTSPYGFVP